MGAVSRKEERRRGWRRVRREGLYEPGALGAVVEVLVEATGVVGGVKSPKEEREKRSLLCVERGASNARSKRSIGAQVGRPEPFAPVISTSGAEEVEAEAEEVKEARKEA